MQLQNLKTSFLGREFKFYEEIDSTQTEIWRCINSKNIKNGLVVMANIQTEGKGTHGRIWHTDEKENIAFSLYIEVNSKIKKMEGITIDIAKVITLIFKEKYNILLDIKHPNDLILNDKKVGGILTESKVNEKIIKYLVIGIGINTNKMYFQEDIKGIATSIKKETGSDIDNLSIVSEFCNKFEELLKRRIEK